MAEQTKPYETSVDFSGTRIADWGCAFSLNPVVELVSLHDSLVSALDPLTKRIYSLDSPYWPHTTALLNAKPDEIPGMRPTLGKIDMTGTMKFESIELIGRVGPARGGEYQILESFKLSG